MSIETAFAQLLGCLAANDAGGVQDSIFDLDALHNGLDQIPDDLVERLLTLLRNERMYESPLAGHVLNFFEFGAPHLSDRAKSLCAGFINAHGDAFKHVHSQQVVVELRFGPYLKMSS